MIQRSQTLFLLAVFILSILMLTGPLLEFSIGNVPMVLKHNGLFDEAAGEKGALSTWPLSIFFVFLALLSFLNIFLYRKRPLQMRICIYSMFLSFGGIALLLYYGWFCKNAFEPETILFKWRIAALPITTILLYFAFRRIRRDELMVKAYDRIR